jgi:F0F1-type ATP synthase assembly protein I
MPLSEHEQRLLDQIERALYAEDPKFASTVRGGRLRKPSRRRRIQGVVLFVVGIVALVLGLVFRWFVGDFPVVSVVGFLLMFGGAVLAITSTGGKKGEAAAGESGGKTPPAGDEKNKFTSRMEERFRKRFEQE